jgi:glycyl-tRNA synthetase
MNNLMEKVVSLCKRRGFVFPGSEIYGGFSGFWDYGPYGVELKNNIRDMWWKRFVHSRDNMYGLDASVIMNPRVWEASGHTGAGFTDPMLKCTSAKCGQYVRIDEEPNFDDSKKNINCKHCGTTLSLSNAKNLNLMFKTHVGPIEGEDTVAFLRPETAQGIFVNFKNVVDSFHPNIPFGIAQVGKAYRNEIAPRDFTFRSREFEQMEIEYFVHEQEWENSFELWRQEMRDWMHDIGLGNDNVHELSVPKGDLAHYSKRTVDFEFNFPFGRKELYGLAYRTDFDLKNHSKHSGVELLYPNSETGDKFTPHVIEPTFGLDRSVLAVLVSAYTEDELGGDKRVYLRLPTRLAPVKVAVFPLLKNKPELVTKARDLYEKLKAKSYKLKAIFDSNGNIGKRYRRQDEIGTPVCITIDFDTLEDESVTVRARDSGEQQRVSISELASVVVF